MLTCNNNYVIISHNNNNFSWPNLYTIFSQMNNYYLSEKIWRFNWANQKPYPYIQNNTKTVKACAASGQDRTGSKE